MSRLSKIVLSVALVGVVSYESYLNREFYSRKAGEASEQALRARSCADRLYWSATADRYKGYAESMYSTIPLVRFVEDVDESLKVAPLRGYESQVRCL